mgnify:CR=1 FL=1
MKRSAIGFALAGLAGCVSRAPVPAPLRPFEHVFFGMGTVWRVEGLAPASLDAPALREALSRRVLEDELLFSDWSEESELRRLERGGLAEWRPASPRFLKLLDLSAEAWRESRGVFDPTIGAVQWKALARPVGLGAMERREGEFRFREDPRRLTFGGIAKGFSVGALGELLVARGFRHFRVNGGGGNLLLRAETGAEPWPELLAYGLEAEALWHVSRSRTARPETSKGAKASQHIYDPRDPRRALNEAATLLCRQRLERDLESEAALSDAASKALVVEPEAPVPPHCRGVKAPLEAPAKPVLQR